MHIDSFQKLNTKLFLSTDQYTKQLIVYLKHSGKFSTFYELQTIQHYNKNTITFF